MGPMIAQAAASSSQVVDLGTGIPVIEFLFGTYAGIGVMVASFLLLSLIVAFYLERRTRKIYKDRGPAAKGSSFFDDDEEDEDDAAE